MSGTGTPSHPYRRTLPTKPETGDLTKLDRTLQEASSAILRAEQDELAGQFQNLTIQHPTSDSEPPDDTTMSNLSPDVLRQIIEGLGLSVPKKNEIRINPPDVFNGETAKAKEFKRTCQSYLRLNEKVYDDSTRQITFVLSYMRNGRASEWAQFWTTKLETPGITYSIHEFWNDFDKAFISADAKGEARSKLYALRQTNSADKYNTQFQMFATQAEIEEYNALVEPYQ